MSTSTELRHGEACRFAGLPLGPRGGSDGRVPLSHEHCVCDPHGTKARVRARQWERSRRSRVLWQDQVWWDREGNELRLTDLSHRYLSNLLGFLEARAQRFYDTFVWSMAAGPHPSGDAATDAFEVEFDQLLNTKPTTWLYSTPLLVMLERLVRDGHDGPIDRTYPYPQQETRDA